MQEDLIKRKTELWSAKKNYNEGKIASLREKKLIEQQYKKLNRETRFFLVLSLFCGISFLIGLRLTFRGYNLWNEKVQKPADERMRVELSKLKSQ